MKPSHELTLLYQEAPATEKFAKNGTTKNVNLVVKKVPFTIIIGSKGSTVDFNVSHIAAMLIYDHPDRKEVDFVKTAPIEYETDIAKDGKKKVPSSSSNSTPKIPSTPRPLLSQ
eukprot:TRINITY_DN6095_c0_g1_i2.p2 TRINITY_DN6095_c0_g1~~TRINITY_DN6095_c0_g1_i2.p2  ORF type:complete len:114 (-),score=15.74 TRINITY_DN6095_c0_g1_i2:761-1102(-)